MGSIFITSTNTGVGKTFAMLKFIKAYSKLGYRVGVFKPVETGVIKYPLDGSSLLKGVKKFNKSSKQLSIKDVTSYTFKLSASPFVAKNKKNISLEKIIYDYKRIKRENDIVLIEGAGGLLVPINKNFFMIDLIKHLKSKIILVTPDSLGCINDTLLSMEALQNRELSFCWCVNIRDSKTFKKVTKPFYRRHFKSILTLQDDSLKIAKSLMSKHKYKRVML